MPDELAPQSRGADELFGAFGWTCTDAGELEADDLLGSYALAEAEAGGTALLMTGDRDLFQCAAPQVTVLYLKTGVKGFEEIDAGRGRAALRHPAGARAGLHRPARRPVRRPPRRARDRREDGSRPAAPPRLAGGGPRRPRRREAPRRRGALREQGDELRGFLDIATLRRIDVERPADRVTDLIAGAGAAEGLGMHRLAARLRGVSDPRSSKA